MTTTAHACRGDGADTLLAVRVHAGSSTEGPGDVIQLPSPRGGDDRTYVVWRVRARAVEGRANAALVRSVAGYLGLRPGAVQIARGERTRDKLIRVHGQPVAEVVARLSARDRRA
jgi:hypothetical protein